MWNNYYRLLVEELGRHQVFLPTDYPFYVLMESCGADQEREEEHFMTVLGTLLEEGAIASAVIAQSGQQANQLWEMRDDVEALAHALNPVAAFDISLPIRDMESYVNDVERELATRWPGTRVVTFGHLGDGNIHLGVGPVQDRHGVESMVYERLAEAGGSVSAEHGIGLEKKAFLPISRNKAEIALMKTLKFALDPNNILNPDKVLHAQL
jgi:FAD/FMN-containing dehydrogenase